MSVHPLVIDGLCKEYRPRGRPRVRAVMNLSLTIARAECVAVLGPNGAGKSSAIHCITGYYPASAGRVLINGTDVSADPRRARARLGVCFQEDCLDEDLNVLDQLVQYARYFGASRRQAVDRARELVERFMLADHAASKIDQLSGGTRRRLQVARALVNDPTVVILDEPTTGLDPEARKMVWSIFHDCRRRGAAILLTTHFLHEAEQLADRVAIMDGGELRDLAPVPELIARHVGPGPVRQEVAPGHFIDRAPTLEDVFFQLIGDRALPEAA